MSSLVTPGPASQLAEPQPQATLPQSSSAQKLHVEQPDPATVGDEPLSGYRLFDIRPLVEFVQQFPCPTCQHSGYNPTELGRGLATTVRFTCRFKRSFLHFGFLSRACSLMSRYLEKLLTDVCVNWHIVEAIQVEEVGLK